MNNNKLLVTVTFLFALTLAACGGSGSGSGSGGGSGTAGGSTSGMTTGTITLTGNDTDTVGTTLDTGFIGSSLAAAGQPDYVVIVDQVSTVSFTPPNILIPDLADPANGFVLVVTDEDAGIKAISMSIFVGGLKYDFVCNRPMGPFTDCGVDTIVVDIAGRTVTLNNTITENKISKEELILDGTLTW